jgi:hypothetical protein
MNATITFEVFDVFSNVYADSKDAEKYNVFVRRMNTRSKN